MSAFRVVRLVAGNARVVAANPQLRRVLVAWGVGIAGEWAFLVVLSVTAYERGGAAAVSSSGRSTTCGMSALTAGRNTEETTEETPTTR